MPHIVHMVAVRRNLDVLSCSLCMLKQHDPLICDLIEQEVNWLSMLLLQWVVLQQTLSVFEIWRQRQLWVAHTQDPELEMGKYKALATEVVEVAR